MLVRLEEEKRGLELELVGERAKRDQDGKNASADLENARVQLNTQMYALRCEGETWRRKAEANQQEVKWLKEQMKTLEVRERIEEGKGPSVGNMESGV
jgi:hypothetical protein